jgi:hypothetical protein
MRIRARGFARPASARRPRRGPISALLPVPCPRAVSLRRSRLRVSAAPGIDARDSVRPQRRISHRVSGSGRARSRHPLCAPDPHADRSPLGRSDRHSTRSSRIGLGLRYWPPHCRRASSAVNRSAPFLGQPVLVPRRSLVVEHSLEDSLLDESVQAVGEHVPGDAETLLELANFDRPRKASRRCAPASPRRHA